ncbi:MAG: hypothetical protein VW146_00520 [Gammaproteobacteria bacterium]
MNEKYIQALIVGSLIGGAIILDDFLKPKPNFRGDHVMMFKGDGIDMPKMHHPKILEKRVWKDKDGEEIELSDTSSEKKVIMLKLDDDTDLEAALEKIEIDGVAEGITKIDIEKIVNTIKNNIGDEDAKIEVKVKIEKESDS